MDGLKMSDGFKPGDLYWLRAFEQSGKSRAFADEVSKAKAKGKKVYVIDYEHPEGGYYV
jgi:hypothetical protein